MGQFRCKNARVGKHQETWVVKHERYEQPTYVRLYGPFPTGEAASAWSETANLPDFWVALRVSAPEKLPEELEELRRREAEDSK